MTRALLPMATAWLVLVFAVPAQARGKAEQDYSVAIKRLRGCLDAGLGGAPRDSLRSAVTMIRVLCTPQIRAAHAASDRKVEVEHPALAAGTAELTAQKRAARAELDDEVAILVANRTGIRN